MLFAAEELPVQTAADAANANAYRVLAHKYRPQNFSQLIGQDALVRTLTNAINMGRLAHAWLLTGIRGIKNDGGADYCQGFKLRTWSYRNAV